MVDKEVEVYFIERYRESLINLVPDLWPKFKTKEEVDRWIGTLEKIFEIPPAEGPAVFCDSGHCRFRVNNLDRTINYAKRV